MKRPGSKTSTRYNRKGSKCEQRDLSTGRLLGHMFDTNAWGRRCRRCGHWERSVDHKKKPFGDKRNFRRSDPRYAEYQKILVATNGYV